MIMSIIPEEEYNYLTKVNWIIKYNKIKVRFSWINELIRFEM